MPTTDQQVRHLAHLMCDATRDLLWARAPDTVRSNGLQVRVGSGAATYHRFDPSARVHRITYGQRMVAAKQQPAQAVGWLSAREIRGRGYFDGVMSTLNLLAHTCCHEFAHLLQYSAGERRYRSVHNRAFYQHLDNLHASGAAEAVRHHLRAGAETAGVHLPDTEFDAPSPTALRARWSVGDPVVFGEGPRRHRGQVERVNRKTCTVRTTHPVPGVRYRVPMVLLRTLETA